MNRRKPELADQSGGPGPTSLLAAGLALLVVSSCVACSSGSRTGSTTAATSTVSSVSASPSITTSLPNPSKTPEPAATSTSRPGVPVAHCPVIKAAATPQVPLECTSATVIGDALARVGLHRDADEPTLLPILYLLSYTRTDLAAVSSRRSAYIFHYTNGAVASMLCSGVVAKTLDPVLGACLDVGPSTRTDRPAVRAWALRAETTITKSAKAQPTLRSGTLTFVACSDPSFPKSVDTGVAFEMNIYIEHSGSPTTRGDCSR